MLDTKRIPLLAVNMYLKKNPRQGTISDEQGNLVSSHKPLMSKEYCILVCNIIFKH